MKIGIITYHFPWNCGAMLQCAALQAKLESMGHEVCVIDYRPIYHENRYAALKHPVYMAKRACELNPQDSPLIHIARGGYNWAKGVKSWKDYAKLKPREQLFRAFRERYFHETRCYRTLEQLQQDPPDCDVLIAGSDQVWNARITNGRLDPAYFLQFGSDDVRRIAYSVGADFAVLDDPVVQVSSLVGRFDAIALREAKCLEAVKDGCAMAGCSDIPLCTTLDPTLLMDASDYDDFMDHVEVPSTPYILTYTMFDEASRNKCNRIAQSLSEDKGIPVIDVSGSPRGADGTGTRLVGPSEFLAYVKGASCVVTNSFHATTFSVIFRRPFAVVPHSQTGQRMVELCDALGLESRCVHEVEDGISMAKQPVNYEQCDLRLAKLRQGSIDYLNRFLSE